MSTVKKEVTEKKKTKSNVKLSRDKQEKVRTLSKIIYILARILKVFMIIGVVGIIIAMIFTPVIVKNVKIEDNAITLFGNKVDYKVTDDRVDIMMGNIAIGSLTEDEKIGFDYVISELDNMDFTRTFAYVEIGLLVGGAILIFSYYILKYTDNLFVNIHSNDTPFTEENLNYIKKIAYFTLVTVIVSMVGDVLSTLFFDNSIISVDLMVLAFAALLYVISYIFEYACILQKNSKVTMYGEIDE